MNQPRGLVQEAEVTGIIKSFPRMSIPPWFPQPGDVGLRGKFDGQKLTGETYGAFYDPQRDIRLFCPPDLWGAWVKGEWSLSSDNTVLDGYSEGKRVRIADDRSTCIIEDLGRRRLSFTRIKLCGPDITDHLTDVLENVRSSWEIDGLERSQKEELCNVVRSWTDPLQTVVAWDICQLWLPETYWLYQGDLETQKCGTPAQGEPGDEAIETLPDSPCGNSVQVGEHCYLAGTVNYALFGTISELCHSEFRNFDIDEMKRKIRRWKIVEGIGNLRSGKGFDDPNPPIAWAEWAYKRLPVSDVPTGAAANRDMCQLGCDAQVPFERFTWRWLPYHNQSCPAGNSP
jgi:hypothetical protein